MDHLGNASLAVLSLEVLIATEGEAERINTQSSSITVFEGVFKIHLCYQWRQNVGQDKDIGLDYIIILERCCL